MRPLWITIVVAGGIAGCQAAKPEPKSAPTSVTAVTASADSSQQPIGESARSAAMLVAAMPEINHPLTEREIDLWAALFRASYESNVGDFTSCFVLEQPPAESLPAMAIDHREFLLRVLANLAVLDVPMTWAPPGRGTGMAEYYPGTRERATRLRIRLIKRMDDQATVQAEVSDWTADVGSSRQSVLAVWDGQKWDIQRDRVRLVW